MDARALDAFLTALLHDADLHEKVREMEGQDPSRIALAKAGAYPPALLARQVAGRAISRLKAPFWYEDLRIAYPPKQNFGQASQHQAAAFKAFLLRGEAVADLTGGTGIDAWQIAQAADRFLYNEPDPELFRIAAHNLGLLGRQGLHLSQQKAEEVWADANALLPYSALYLDPSRLEEGRKVISLTGYSPDITQLPASVLQTKKLMVKLGPMLDIQEMMKALPWVRQVLVISIRNEVKELLALNWMALDGPGLQALELDWRGHCFRYHAGMEPLAGRVGSGPVQYLFEPGAALVKAGLARPYGMYAGLERVHPEVPLYFSPTAEALFGKTYHILEWLYGSPEEIRKRFQNAPVDIAAKGYKMTAEQIAARYRFRTGGGQMLYFTKVLQEGKDRHVCLVLERVLN